MAELKTKPTEVTVESFLTNATNEKVRKDCHKLITMMEKVTGEKPKMWGPSIIGFGEYHYKYDSGREGDICLTGFSPRKGNITIYGMGSFTDQPEVLSKLGKVKATKGCLYIKKLDDINLDVLESLILQSVDFLKKKHHV